MGGKSLQELTIKDNFMFSAVMMDEENCRCFLEMTLGFPISRVEVSREKSMVYHPEYKGIRLDIYAKDEKNTHYNIEMQVLQKPALERRARYYHSQMDMELLAAGRAYKNLPHAYVIFVCDFDPFGYRKYCYTFENYCNEVDNLRLKDGAYTIFLSTQGENSHEVPDKLVKFLKFVKAELSDSTNDFKDEYVKQLQESVRMIKANREMEERFMVLREMLEEERMEGREEGRMITLIEVIQKLKLKNKSAAEIAELLTEDIQEVTKIFNAIDMSHEKIAQKIFEELYGN